MIRIAISQAAFDALAATLPLGSVGYENATKERGERYVWLAPTVIDSAARHAGAGREPSASRESLRFGALRVLGIVGVLIGVAFVIGTIPVRAETKMGLLFTNGRNSAYHETIFSFVGWGLGKRIIVMHSAEDEEAWAIWFEVVCR
jgi:hypothetical protein